MTRMLALGFLGLVLAVAVGLGIHALTRETIALPVVRLEQGASLAPPAARARQTPPATTGAAPATSATTTGSTDGSTGSTGSTDSADEDNSGSGSSDSGRGRGRGHGGDDD